MSPDDPVIHSPLERTLTEEDTSVEVFIYRLPDTGWTLEVVDDFGNSTVWDDAFETDQAALDEVHRTLREDGIDALVGDPPQGMAPEEIVGPQVLSTPLTDEELDELATFLVSDATSDHTMRLDTLDGYLTAIAIGPTSLRMSQWYSGIWGEAEHHAPAFETMEQARRIMEMIMRHYNSIIASLDYDADTHEPVFDEFIPEVGDRTFVDGEMWAYGFMQGLSLCRSDWQPLFDHADGLSLLRPIYLLGSDDVNEEEDALTKTPEQREELALEILESLPAIYRFWLPYRRAILELEMAKTYQRTQPKVGRNDPCPCGSGKKFKKCCGVASELH